MLRDKLKQRISNEPTGCISYLKELVMSNRVYDGEALEIIMYVIKNGPEQLTNIQWDFLLDKGLLPDFYVECDRCEDTIQWSDMYQAIFIKKDYCCPYCSYLVNKKDGRLLD